MKYLRTNSGSCAVLVAALGMGLFTGCVSHEKIPFSDEPTVSSQVGAESLPPTKPVPKLAPADQLLVDAVVYDYLLQRDFWSSGEYTAVFLQGDDSEVAAIQSSHPGHKPPIKESNRALLQPNRTPIDKDTGKPAMILSVETADPVDDTVVAIGRWYAGGAMTGYYTFNLKKTGAAWTIDSVK